jgi:hypothetical protein
MAKDRVGALKSSPKHPTTGTFFRVRLALIGRVDLMPGAAIQSLAAVKAANGVAIHVAAIEAVVLGPVDASGAGLIVPSQANAGLLQLAQCPDQPAIAPADRLDAPHPAMATDVVTLPMRMFSDTICPSRQLHGISAIGLCE